MALETDGHAVSSRKSLKVAVAALCAEVGFGSAEDASIETLVEALQSYLVEAGKSTRALAELAGRTDANVNDVALALIEMGCNINGLPDYAKRPNKSVFMPPQASTSTASVRTLQVGEKRQHPPHIPSYLPPFPDPHTYIKSDALRQPFNEYQLIREKAATQKRDVERALTRLIANTGETQSLSRDDPKAFPLIAVKPTPFPYLDALLPKDYDQEAASLMEKHGLKKPTVDLDVSLDEPLKVENGDLSGSSQGNDSQEPEIDNPYLRTPRKMTKT